MFKLIEEKLKFNNFPDNKNLVLPSIIISLGILLPLNPFSNESVQSFDRSFGNALLNGVDINKRLNSISIFNFIILPLVLAATYFFMCKLLGSYKKEDKEIKFLNTISIISLFPMILAHLNKYSHPELLGIEVICPIFLIILTVVYLVLLKKDERIEFNVFKWLLFAIIPVTLFIILITRNTGIFYLSITVDNKYTKLFISSFMVMIIYSFVFISSLIIIHRYINKININSMMKAYVPIMITPIVMSIVLELINVLNQYSIFINFKLEITFIVNIFAFLLFIIFYRVFKNKENNNDFCFEKYYYPIVILTFALISVQPNLQNTFNTDFFEQSNHGTALSELFRYGKVPIIETFDAHMLQNQIGNILYGIINNDFKGAIFFGYSISPLIFILYYLLFSKFFGRDISLLIIILFPIQLDYTYKLFPLAPLVILSFLNAYKKQAYRDYILYWLTIGITCLFKLDMGFALTFASIITWGIVYILKRDSLSIKKLLISALIIIATVLTIFSCICIMKNIKILDRIIEFLSLCKSNINWAYSGLGNANTIAFVMCYFIIPSITLLLIIKLVLKKFKEREYIDDDKFIILIIVGLLCIFNFQRGIVRHSLVENTLELIISSAPLFICMYVYIFSKQNKLMHFCATNIVLMIFCNLLLTSNNIIPSILMNSSMTSYLNFNSYNTIATEKKQRVLLSDDMKNIYMPLKKVFDETLEPDETYIDFTNQTLLYSLTEREKPVYINQSPGLLSNEYTQEKFLEQCDTIQEKIPFVLMPLEPMNLSYELDGIQNAYRYYLVSEYINTKYKPLFKTDSFAIWCKNDVYEEKYKLLSQLINKDKNYYEVKLNDLSLLDINNATLTMDDNNIKMNSVSPDAMIIGLEKLVNITRLSENGYKYINISINYESDIGGMFQCYYTTNEKEDFSEEKSVAKELSNKGEFNVKIPITDYSKIRLDIPDNSNVEINSIKYEGIDNDMISDVDFIGYDYRGLENHTYNLGEIPYIWAQYDSKSTDKKEEQLIIGDYFDIFSIDTEQGNYLYVNSDSVTGGSMNIQLGKKDNDTFIPLIQYNFNVKEGNNSEYLIRVSSDFMWYSNEINTIKVSSDNNSTINKVSILKGDKLN